MSSLDEQTSRDRLKADMTAAWDHGAADYDAHWGHGLQTTAERDAWLALLNRLVPPMPPLRILDIGTGTGFLALLLSQMGHEVIGIDLSEGMLAVARSEADTRRLGATFAVGDAESPPAGLGQFDVVVARHVLWTLLQPEVAVRAWTDLLRAQGRVIVIDGIWKPTAVLDRALAATGRVIQQLRPGRHHGDHSYPAAASGRLPLQHLTSLEPARNVFVRAGLTDVLAEELAWIDHLERSLMPLEVRLQSRYRRYLLEGRRPG